MTRHVPRRCWHCRAVYNYVTSSYAWPPSAANNDRYCPSCMTNVLDALSRAPKAVKRTTVDVPPDSEEWTRVWQQYKAGPSAAGTLGLKVRSYRPGLSKIQHGRLVDVEHVDVVMLDQVEYNVHVWRKGSHPPRITKAMERDLRTGELQPWRHLT